MTPLIGITLGTHRPSNSDSHFWQLRGYYTNAVEWAGGAPVMIPLGLHVDTLRSIYDSLDGLLISGGGDIDPATYGEERSPYVSRVDSARDEVEITLIRWAIAEQKPLLAICRGHQALNVALGGTLYQDIGLSLNSNVPHSHSSENWFEILVHDVTVTEGSQLHAALRPPEKQVTVNSLHHQAVKQLGDTLEISARSADGLIEGIEVPGHRFAVGVQWHPEALVHKEPTMLNLFKSLVTHAH